MSEKLPLDFQGEDAEDKMTHTCLWCQSSMDPDLAICSPCWEMNMGRLRNERDHALDDLKAETANHREDNAFYRGTLEKCAEAFEFLARYYFPDGTEARDLVKQALQR